MAIADTLIRITEGDDHRYYNGLPSVTTIVDILHEHWLTRWRGKVGNEEADRIAGEAAWLGTLVHDTLTANELYGKPITQADLVNLDPIAQHAVSQYLDWSTTVLDYWLLYEEPMTSKELGIGGTPDRVGVLKGEPDLVLVDFKTGNVSFKHRFQTAGYKLLLRANGINVKRRIVLYMPKSIEKGSKLVVKEHLNHTADERGFMDCLDLYNIIKTVN